MAINIAEIESHLWESANILRGPVDAADFKTYIFPLLFFKRICDVWDEEYEEIVTDTGDAELALFPESHRFQIPEGCHWNDVRAVATNVGNALQRAMREIEKSNPDTLYGVFGETIYDPACGTGGMLLAAVQHVKDQHGDVKRLWGKLFGQEKNLTTSSIARMNLFLHGIEDFQIVRGDTLRNPAFFDGDHLANFDCVIANPPFSLEKWGEEQWINDPFGRNFAGLPPSSSGDFAWVQHMVKSMADVKGRMAVVLPQGALFRKGAEGAIRQKLLEMDLVEAVTHVATQQLWDGMIRDEIE